MSDYRDALAWADAQIAAARDDPAARLAAVPRADRPGIATTAVPARLWTHLTAPPLPLAGRTTGPRLRSEYGDNYYAAFVSGHDGHDIEVVTQRARIRPASSARWSSETATRAESSSR